MTTVELLAISSRMSFVGRGVVVTTQRGSLPRRRPNLSMSKASGGGSPSIVSIPISRAKSNSRRQASGSLKPPQ